jgi:hypothetical protein
MRVLEIVSCFENVAAVVTLSCPKSENVMRGCIGWRGERSQNRHFDRHRMRSYAGRIEHVGSGHVLLPLCGEGTAMEHMSELDHNATYLITFSSGRKDFSRTFPWSDILPDSKFEDGSPKADYGDQSIKRESCRHRKKGAYDDSRT